MTFEADDEVGEAISFTNTCTRCLNGATVYFGALAKLWSQYAGVQYEANKNLTLKKGIFATVKKWGLKSDVQQLVMKSHDQKFDYGALAKGKHKHRFEDFLLVFFVHLITKDEQPAQPEQLDQPAA